MSGSMVAELTAAANVPSDMDVVIVAAKLGAQFLGSLATALETYKTTGQLPPMEASELTRFNDFAKNKGQDPAKRRKKGEKKLNKDGSEKAPRKPTAYNHWMQEKLKELKEDAPEGSEEKHVDRFKAAAEFWRAMPKEEKAAISQKFKEQQAMALAVGGAGEGAVDAAATAQGDADSSDYDDVAGLPLPAEESSESESESDEEDVEVEVAPPPQPVIAAARPRAAEPSKKKKRKPDAAPAVQPPPVATAAPVSEGEKKKKKKKKLAAVPQPGHM